MSYTGATIQSEVFIKALPIVQEKPGDCHTSPNMLVTTYTIMDFWKNCRAGCIGKILTNTLGVVIFRHLGLCCLFTMNFEGSSFTNLSVSVRARTTRKR